MASNLTSQVRSIARSPPRWPTATCPRRSPSTPRARSSSSRTPSTPWSTSCRRSPTRSPASPARSAPKAASAARRRGRRRPGVWKDLTDNVNSMADNLTYQVRNIAQVTTAVANGDLTQEDRRGRPGRDPGAEDHHQHDGRPAVLVRRRGHPGRPRGRQRGPARRPGRGRGRLRHLEAAHRERQRAGEQPDHPGARHRRGGQRGRRRRPDPVDHGRGARRGRRAQGQRQPDGGEPARDHPRQPASRTG